MSMAALKWTALVFMVIDHIGMYIPGTPIWLNYIGRLSAPIFLFCVVWSLDYTRSRKRYVLRLYLCGVGMGVLCYLLNTLRAFHGPYLRIDNNIFATLFATSLLICLLERRKQDKSRGRWLLLGYCLFQLAVLIGIVALEQKNQMTDFLYHAVPALTGNVFLVEGGFAFVVLGVALYYTKANKKNLALWYGGIGLFHLITRMTGWLAIPLARATRALVTRFPSLSTLWGIGLEELVFGAFRLFGIWPYGPWGPPVGGQLQWLQVFALPFMLSYNGKKGRSCKYFFYVFYPAHIVALWALGNLLA